MNIMNDKITTIMNVNENEVRVMRINGEDYISLTDLARYKNPNDSSDVIKKVVKQLRYYRILRIVGRIK